MVGVVGGVELVEEVAEVGEGVGEVLVEGLLGGVKVYELGGGLVA